MSACISERGTSVPATPKSLAIRIWKYRNINTRNRIEISCNVFKTKRETSVKIKYYFLDISCFL